MRKLVIAVLFLVALIFLIIDIANFASASNCDETYQTDIFGGTTKSLYSSFGRVFYNNKTYWNFCSGDNLTFYYCDNDILASKNYSCEDGCEKQKGVSYNRGRCIFNSSKIKIEFSALKDIYFWWQNITLTTSEETPKEIASAEAEEDKEIFERKSMPAARNGYIIELKELPLISIEDETQKEVDKLEGEVKKEEEKMSKKGITGRAIEEPDKIKEKKIKIAEKKAKIKEARDKHKLKLKKERQEALDDINAKIKGDIFKRVTGFVINLISGKAVSQESNIIEEYYNVFNGIAMDIKEKDAEKIRKSKYIKAVYYNEDVNMTLMDSIPLINADDAWQMQDFSGMDITGKNITIAIIDTGVDYTHPDLGECFGENCKVIGGYNFIKKDPKIKGFRIERTKKIRNPKDPMDDHGHGTHVAGIAAGSGQGGLKGVAPDAKILAYKVLDSYGSGTFAGVIAGIERAVDPNKDNDFSDKADIISMSLGGGVVGDFDSPLSIAVDNAVDAGVVAVVAAGNSGPWMATVMNPASARKAITVGAVFKKDYEGKYWKMNLNPKADDIASFSSRGPAYGLGLGFTEKLMSVKIWGFFPTPSMIKYIIKPDVVAPGAIICSARYDSIFPEGSHEYYKPCLDDKHVQLAGTSMATPIVSGAAALIKQAHPDWTPEEIKLALRNTAKDLSQGTMDRNYESAGAKGIEKLKDIISQGYGRIDVEKAIKSNKPVIAELEPLIHSVSGGDGFIQITITGIIIMPDEEITLPATININGRAFGENFKSYKVYYGKNNLKNMSLICEGNKEIKTGILCSGFDTSTLTDGYYFLKLEVYNNIGESSYDVGFFKISRCGNNIIEKAEECDGSLDDLCENRCSQKCKCLPKSRIYNTYEIEVNGSLELGFQRYEAGAWKDMLAQKQKKKILLNASSSFALDKIWNAYPHKAFVSDGIYRIYVRFKAFGKTSEAFDEIEILRPGSGYLPL